MQKTRIFFATDIHGSDVCFKKFINASSFYKARVIILGGDITGKALIPIFDRGNYYEVIFLGSKHKLSGEKKLREMIERIRGTGCYTYLTSEDEWIELKSNPERMNEVFNEVVKDSIREWVTYADERLKGKDVVCLIQPGNDDGYFIDDVLNSSSTIINSNEKVVTLDDKLQVLSLGYSNITPWSCPRDIPDEEISRKIEELISECELGSKLIFNIHVPPYGTGIDEAPELDDEMRPKVGPGGQILTKPVGSKAVREAIVRYEPLLGLHGHIHEARGFFKLGKTLCLNPGSEYAEGILRGVLIQVTDYRVRDFIFTSG